MKKQMLSRVMRKAWEIFRTIGKKTNEAFSQALRMAWTFVKEELTSPIKQVVVRKSEDRPFEIVICGAKAILRNAAQELTLKVKENGLALPNGKLMLLADSVMSLIHSASTLPSSPKVETKETITKQERSSGEWQVCKMEGAKVVYKRIVQQAVITRIFVGREDFVAA